MRTNLCKVSKELSYESSLLQVFSIFISAGRAVCFTGLCLVAIGCAGPNSVEQGGANLSDSSGSSLTEIKYLPPQYSWKQPPEQVPVKEGFFDVGGAKLWYWDTGGDGEAVVFSHPSSGSGLTWEYQQPFLSKEGYRVIGYSRRGHFQSEITDSDIKANATDDLLKLVDYLGIDKFHIVAIAGGGNVAPDFATTYPDRLLSLIVGCTIGQTSDTQYSASNDMLMPPEFSSLPVYLKELSPFYRGANPEGTLAWIKISDKARTKRVRTNLNQMTPELLKTIRHPTLLFTGDSDFYMPPSRLRAYAKYWTNPEVVIFRGAGHAPYWEQPLAFNQMLLDFMRRNGK